MRAGRPASRPRLFSRCASSRLKQPRRRRVAAWLTGQSRCHNRAAMGKVVQFDGSDGKPRPSRGRRRKRGDKTALVLGGGGFTGGVYEIGALRALRPARRQPHRQRVRRLRRHQRRLVRGQHGRQRGHARGDDARPQQGAALADRGPHACEPCCARTTGASSSGLALMPLRVVGTLRHLAGNIGEISMVDVVDGARRGPPDRASTATGGWSSTWRRSSPTPTAPTTSASSSASC